MASQQTKVGLDYRRYTESKQAASSSTQSLSATSVAAAKPNLKAASKIPSAGLTRSVSAVKKSDRTPTRAADLVTFKPRPGLDRSTSRPSRQTLDQAPLLASQRPTPTSTSVSVSSRVPSRIARKPQVEPVLKRPLTQQGDTNGHEKRAVSKHAAEMSAEEVHEMHPLSYEEKLAARQRAEQLHEHVFSRSNVESARNSAEMSVNAMPEPRTHEFPGRSDLARDENPLYKSRLQTRLVTEPNIPQESNILKAPAEVRMAATTAIPSGTDAAIEAAVAPCVLTKSCAMVTEIMSNPYAGISVENLLTEMTRLENVIKAEERTHKEAVTVIQGKLDSSRDNIMQLEHALEEKLEAISALNARQLAMEQAARDMATERDNLNSTIQLLNERVASLHDEINSMIAAGKKQEEKHVSEINGMREALQKAMESIHQKESEKSRLQDQIQALEGSLRETQQQLDTTASEAEYIHKELMGMSERMKECLSNERTLTEALSHKEAEMAQLQEEINRHNSEKAMNAFENSAASLLTAITTEDFSAQVNFLSAQQKKETDALKEQISKLERQLNNFKTTYSGVRVVPSENGDLLQDKNNVDVRVLPCEHCDRSIDFMQVMLDLTDLRKLETEWMVDTEATKAENAKLKAALLELGRRYKALQAANSEQKTKLQSASANGTAGTGTEQPVVDSETISMESFSMAMQDGPTQEPDEENKTMNFKYMKLQ